jgi:predicted PurR-regulated permease PerM
VFGTIGVTDGSPSSTYQVDDLPASTFVFTANGETNYRIPFYASPLLNAGNHTLVITSLGNNNGSRIWLDYILYFPTINELVSNSSETSIPSTSTSPASASSSATSMTHGASTNTVAIVGGVLGSVVGIILAMIIFAYIILRWRHKHANQSVTVTPYNGLANKTGEQSTRNHRF